MQLSINEFNELLGHRVQPLAEKLMQADQQIARLEEDLAAERYNASASRQELEIANARHAEAIAVGLAERKRADSIQAEVAEARRLLGEEQLTRERNDKSLRQINDLFTNLFPTVTAADLIAQAEDFGADGDVEPVEGMSVKAQRLVSAYHLLTALRISRSSMPHGVIKAGDYISDWEAQLLAIPDEDDDS